MVNDLTSIDIIVNQQIRDNWPFKFVNDVEINKVDVPHFDKLSRKHGSSLVCDEDDQDEFELTFGRSPF
jgi:hypothetical protein